MHFIRALLKQSLLVVLLVMGSMAIVSSASAQAVVVHGNQRVDTETIRSFFKSTDEAGVNDAVKGLYATGLFSDVKVARAGKSVVVTVAENGVINRVAFEGNSKLKSDQLADAIDSKSRGPYDPSMVQADVGRIQDLYSRGGHGAAKVTYRIVNLPDGRVDVVYTIDEGAKTGIKTINFVGNQAYSSGRLRDMMQLTEMNFLSFIKNTDIYDPDKLSADEETIRRFYLKNGYADFRITGSDATYDATQQGYIITITVDEGSQYHIASVNIDSHLNDVSSDSLRSEVGISPGDIYNGDSVDKAVDRITQDVTRRGYAFASARPTGDRDMTNHTIALGFVVEEGPRVYIERIDIHGNTRTRDYVIRREFDIGEGDAYNKVLIDRAEKRLNSLGFFKTVKITNEPGSAPDRIIIDVNVEDQPTGSFAVSGGYSTTDGFLAEVSVTESNFLGRGQFVRAALTVGQHSRGVDLSFTEPYFLGSRIGAGVDLFAKETDASKYTLYQNWITGATLRLGLPINDELSFSPRYSLYENTIKISNNLRNGYYNDCSVPVVGVTPLTPGQIAAFDAAGNTAFDGNPAATYAYNCLGNGEASLAVKQAAGSRLTSEFGYSLTYSTLDSPKDPHEGVFAELRQDIAGAGGSERFVRTTVDGRAYHELFDNVVGIAHIQAGDVFAFGGYNLRIVDNFNPGSDLVRGFAPGGIGPRDSSNLDPNSNSLGGTKYFGGSLEAQFPIFGLPREIGLKGAIFADAGTVFGYSGTTNFATLFGLPAGTACQAPLTLTNPAGGQTAITQGTCISVQDSKKIRSSVGASLIWASPLGPIRFNYAFATSKAPGDVTQAFSFSGGSTF